MTCEECERILLDSRNATRNDGRIVAVFVLNLAQSHAESCSACAAKMSELTKLDDALSQLRASTINMKAPAVVETNLLAVFRRMRPVRRECGASTFSWRIIWGSAVVLLLVSAGVILYAALRPRSPITAQAERKDREHLAEERLPTVLSPLNAGRAVIENYRPGFDRKAATSSVVRLTKRGKRFHEGIRQRPALPVGEELYLNGGSTVVRVTLPLSNLAAMGVPVYPGISDQRVTADVAIDPFGAVIAIHMVELKPSAN
jgi:hypothetical protein